MHHGLIWAVYWIGWVIFVVAQAHNSILSNSNALQGWPGFKRWLEIQWANLLVRAFFSAVFAGYIIQQVAEKLQSAGLPMHALGMDALAGFAANALLYQALGMVPWLTPILRAEVSQLAPPPSSEVPNSKPEAKP
jgi:hypothetical protein